MDPAFNCAQWLIKHFRDLMIFKTFKVKHEWLAKDSRQCMYSSLYFFDMKVRFCSIRYCTLLIIEKEIISRIVEDGILFEFPPVVVDKDVAHDGIKPCLDICANTILLLIRESPVHCFL